MPLLCVASLGLTFLVAAFVIEWHMLFGGMMHQAFCGLQVGTLQAHYRHTADTLQAHCRSPR